MINRLVIEDFKKFVVSLYRKNIGAAVIIKKYWLSKPTFYKWVVKYKDVPLSDTSLNLPVPSINKKSPGQDEEFLLALVNVKRYLGTKKDTLTGETYMSFLAYVKSAYPLEEEYLNDTTVTMRYYDFNMNNIGQYLINFTSGSPLYIEAVCFKKEKDLFLFDARLTSLY